MTQYAVLLPGREDTWETAPPEERARIYGKHEEFAKVLAQRGHKITGGAELRHSREARVLRRAGEGLTVTQGPYAESVEQLTGFYTVETDDLDDLLQVCGVLVEAGEVIEVRACVEMESAG